MTDSPQPTQPHKHPIPLWLWATWIITALIVVGIAFDIAPALRGDADWRWPYDPIVAPAA